MLELSSYRRVGRSASGGLLSLEIDASAEEGAGHHELVDFGGAAADPGVAEHVVPMGDRHVQGLSDAAENLHDLVDTAPAPLTGGVLDHGGFDADVLAGVGAGRGFAGDGAEGDDIHVYVGKHPLDCLAVGDGPAVGDALLGPVDGHLEGAGQDAQSHCAAQQAVVVHQPLLTEIEPLTDLSQHLSLGDADVIQMDVVLLGLGGHNPDSDGLESDAGSGVVDDEHGDAAALGDLIGIENIIALDIGGTTAKCSLIEDGRVRISTEYMIEKTPRYAGYPILAPVVDIVEIGAGGGSIIWSDEGGKLHVGPQSAGAVPGPAAYGRGGMQPTLTDANLVTGRIDPEYFLGGRIKADMDSIAKAFQYLSKRLGMSMEELARGAIRIANNNMINALKLVSVNRGYDPRDFTLVAFGGGGAMHASALAAELQIGKVIVPNKASVFSAWGMLMSDLRRDYVVTKPTQLVASSATEINHMYRALEQQAASEFSADDIAQDRLRFERYADMRYHGQEHTVKVPYPEGAVTTKSIDLAIDIFQREYEREYTYRLDTAVELISYHVVAFGNVDKPRPQKLERSGRTLDKCIRGYRLVDFDVAGVHEATIYERAGLEPGMQIFGPAIVEEPDTTVVLFPQQELTIDDYGNLRIQTNTSST